MKNLAVLAALTALLFTACSSSDPAAEARKAAEEARVAAEKAAEAAAKAAGKAKPGTPEAAAEEMAKAAEGFGKAMGEMGAAFAKGGKVGAVEPVNFRELKKRLPEKVGGLKRKNAKGSSAGQMGFNVAQAEASYGDGKSTAKVSIVDPGGFRGFLAMAAWANVDIEEESDTGYKKTTTIDGMKAFEEYNNESKRGKVSVIVAQRFVVEASGRGVSMKDLKKAIDDVDIDDLKDLAAKTAKKE
jgi:hypothetical protein